MKPLCLIVALGLSAALACSLSPPVTPAPLTQPAAATPRSSSTAAPSRPASSPTLLASPTGAGVQVNTPTPAPGCQPSGSSELEDALLALINQERARQGAGPLAANAQLATAARAHSADMACNDFFSHTGANGSSPFDRILQAGYGFSAAGENVAAGYGSPQEAFEGWMNSPGHRETMLDPVYIHAAIGYARLDGSQYGTYWTGNFAAP